MLFIHIINKGGNCVVYSKGKLGKSKYRILLVAYKDIPIEVDKEINYHFISKINDFNDLRNNEGAGDVKGSSGLSYRTSLYHSWFKDAIVEKLNEGYTLGIIEMRIDSYEKREGILRKIDEEYGDSVLVVDTAEL